MIPGVVNYTKKLDVNSMDTCEGGRFSCYITSDGNMLPCSFDNQEQRWAYDLSKGTIEEGWNSQAFEDFRRILKEACPGCGIRDLCMGGCPIRPEIVLCKRKEGMV